MRVRVELRRYGGTFIPRFRQQVGFTGILFSGRKEVSGRTVQFLGVKCERKQGYPDEEVPGPELFEARVTEALTDQLRFVGWEVADRAIHCQEWDCFFL